MKTVYSHLHNNFNLSRPHRFRVETFLSWNGNIAPFSTGDLREDRVKQLLIHFILLLVGLFRCWTGNRSLLKLSRNCSRVAPDQHPSDREYPSTGKNINHIVNVSKNWFPQIGNPRSSSVNSIDFFCLY